MGERPQAFSHILFVGKVYYSNRSDNKNRMDTKIQDIEQRIMSSVANGDSDAMELIYTTYIRYLTAVCSRYILNPEDVKDILQESFIKIFSSIASFSYRGQGSLKGWLTKIVVNDSLKFLSQAKRIDFTELSEAESNIADEEPSMDNVPSSVIFHLIRELPDGYRTIFNLYVVEGKSHKEIASMLNITESNSASQ